MRPSVGCATVTWLHEHDDGPIRTLVLDRPERMNAVPADGWDGLAQAFRRFETSDARVLVVTGAGGNFCSGADLDPGAAPDPGIADRDPVAAGTRRMAVVAEAATLLRRCTKPTIAAVDGVAVGAGMNLALGCDVVIASSRARFSEIFVRRGLSIDFGGSWLLPRIVGVQRAKELALTGRMVEAAEAREIGLCLDVVDPEMLPLRANELAAALASAAPIAQMFTKQMLDRSFEMSFEDSVAWEGQSQAICFTTDDFGEGKSAFAERRSPRFGGR